MRLTSSVVITKIGSHAARALAESHDGKIGAIFERSFYVTLRDRWVCLMPSPGGIGPLNALCTPHTLQCAIERLRHGDRVTVAGKRIYVGDSIGCSFATAEIWNPTALQEWDAASLTRGLAALRDALGSYCLPAEGLAHCLIDLEQPASVNAMAVAAREPMRSLQDTLTAAISTRSTQCLDIAGVMPLLGMGAGLTPSGDDAIGGALIVLHCLGCDWLRDALWSELRPRAASSTNQISRAHLEAAAEGVGHEALHAFISSLLSGNGSGFNRALVAIDAIGHTSGWDALAGIVTASRAWLTAATNHLSAGSERA